MLSYQIYRGNLFDMADAAIAFVLSKLDLRVGTRHKGSEAPREYDIPEEVVAEAVINAIAHRDYTSSASVQVELFSDRLVVRNPGRINPAIKKEDLFVEHSSYPNNNLIADQLYQVKYIEKFGTGFTDLVDGCRSAGLSDPVIDDEHSGFALTIWRKRVNAAAETNKKTNKKTNKNTNKKTLGGIAEGAFGQIQLTGSSKVVLTAILKTPEISIAKLSQTTKLSVEGVRYQIAKLKSLVGLVHVGPDKGGHWEVTANR